MNNVVIKVEHLGKQYKLGAVGAGSLGDDFRKVWYRVRGKDNPYLQIGDDNDRNGVGISEYVWALQDINFEVNQGDVLGLIGRNGAGKSTLLKILSRTTAPTIGSIKIKGKIASLLEVGTGFHPELSGRQNIYLNGAILGMTRRDVNTKINEIIDFSGIGRYIDTPVKRYSSGMYVRLAFSVAAHLEPDIMIVDEVLAVGDIEFQQKCLGKMKDVSEREGRTVLFVSHNMDAIKRLCTKGILFEHGKILMQGNIEDVYSKYIKTYKKNFAAGKELLNYDLNNLVSIERFSIDKSIYNAFDEIKFELAIISKDLNPFTGIALLFYNDHDERVAIADLRDDYLIQKGKESAKLSIIGTIKNVPLIEGDYFVGLAIGSALCSGDFFDLLLLSFNKIFRNDKLENYPSSVMGYLNLETTYSIN